MAKLSGARIVCECLVREGVDVIFGYPGGANLPLYDAIPQYPLRHVLVRHEQNAGHAADGYARASGKVGVAFATSGPGATNLVTAVANAMLDSTPVVFITAQVTSTYLGSDAFQETDITGVTLPITKHNYLVLDAADLAPTLREAFHLAKSGRPGPVLVDIPKDVQIQEVEFVYPDAAPRLGSRWKAAMPQDAFGRAAALINEAKRPLILAGQGVLVSGASEELLAMAERAHIPIAQTLLGLDSVPHGHPLALGMMGMHGEAYVNSAVQSADLLLAFGMRFDDRVTGKLSTYAPKAKKVHIDIDAAELNKNVAADLAIHSDLKAALRQILPKVQPAQHAEWLAQIAAWREDTARRDIIAQDAGGKLFAAHVIHDLWRATKGEVILATDVGQHQMWAAQYFKPTRPRSFITSGGLGTMGFGLPAGIGARFARPNTPVWVVAGDGGFQMTMSELATLQQEKLAVKIAIINNGFLGMVRQWQELFYEKRYSHTPMLSPDFLKLAAAYDIPGIRVTRREEVIPAVNQAMETPGSVLVEFRVEKEDLVFPMVPSGTDLGSMLRRPVPADK
jgi:acetolactate synthase-1/2/3 large subunit